MINIQFKDKNRQVYIIYFEFTEIKLTLFRRE